MGVLANIAAAMGPRNDTPIPYTSSRGNTLALGTSGGGSPTAQLEAMGTQGTLFAIVRGLAEGTAKWEWWLERETRGKGDPEKVTSHPALDLLANPNPFMDQVVFMETAQQHLELAGEATVVVSRDPRATIPLELWPVRPDRIAPVPDPQKFMTGWVYTSPDGEKVPLALDEVLWMRYPHPTNPYCGIAPIQAAMTDVDAARYAAQWNRNFFVNSAEPGGFIKVAQELSDTQWRKLRDRWNEQHRGVAAAHRVAILEGVEWESNAFSMRDMQFGELRNVNDEQIRRAYRFPKPMLGDVEDVNRANADAGEYVFGAWLIDPRLSRWAGILGKLLKMFGPAGRGLSWCHEDPSPPNVAQDIADRDSRIAAAVAYMTQGFDPTATVEAFGLPVVQYGLAGSDPDRDLLVKLVMGAPSLAPIILPMLGFDLGVAATPAADATAQASLAALAPWLRANGQHALPAGTG